MIRRNLYIDAIKPYIGKDLIKVLTGQRRVGKSMILKLLAKEIKDIDNSANFIFIDKEDYEFDFIKTDKELNDYIESKAKPSNNYLFIDEVQEIDRFELILRSYNKKDNFDIYCTGSNAKIFSSELTTYLSGRQIILQIGSINFQEFCLFHNLENNQESLLKFISDNTGSMFSANKIKKTDVQGKKHFEVGEKYYFEDIGLRNALVGFKITDIAKIIENIVFLQLKNSGYNISIGYLQDKEIDFVAEKDNEKIYVQVTYLLSEQKTIDMEFGALMNIKDNYPKYVVSFDSFSALNTYKGIKHLTLLEFINNNF